LVKKKPGEIAWLFIFYSIPGVQKMHFLPQRRGLSPLPKGTFA
jgi:hypothetical protein